MRAAAQPVWVQDDAAYAVALSDEFRKKMRQKLEFCVASANEVGKGNLAEMGVPIVKRAYKSVC